jgi:hypothetical protein
MDGSLPSFFFFGEVSMTRRFSKLGATRLNRNLFLGVLFCLGMSDFEKARSEGQSRIVSVGISSDPVRRSEDLKDLSRFDILGVSLGENLAEVRLSDKEFDDLKSMGFQFRFSPLNTQLARESEEPYLTPTQVLDGLAGLAQSYPQFTELKTIGTTRRGRPVQAIVISAHPENLQQPALLFNAMHHARELMTTEVIMHMAQTLLQNYGRDPEITRWLDSSRIILVPQVNPDGNQLVHDGQSMWRKNAWETGGRTYGVDLNRNYPALWGECNGSSPSKTSDSFRGPEAASEPETNAMMKLVREEKPVANISYHSFSEMILYPFGCRSEKNPAVDLFKSIAFEMKENVIDDRGNKNTYAVGTAPELLYEADGTDADWQYREAGVISFAMEVNGRMQGFQPSYSKWRDQTVSRQEGAWKTLIRRTLAQGVKGNLRTGQTDLLSYRIKLEKNGTFEDFTGEDKSVKPFRPRNAEGFIYNVLLGGNYQLEVYSGGELLKAVPFTVEKNKVTDLGDIRI